MLADLLDDKGRLYPLREKAQAALSGTALERTLTHIDNRLEAIE
jgi:hypothetical protein